MTIELTAAEVDLIVWGLTLAYPVLALQLLDPEGAKELLELTTKFEAFKEKKGV